MSDNSTILFGQTEPDDIGLYAVCNMTGFSHVSMWDSESDIECIDQHGDICIIRPQHKPMYVEGELDEPAKDSRGLPKPIKTKIMNAYDGGLWRAIHIVQGKKLTVVEA